MSNLLSASKVHCISYLLYPKRAMLNNKQITHWHLLTLHFIFFRHDWKVTRKQVFTKKPSLSLSPYSSLFISIRGGSLSAKLPHPVRRMDALMTKEWKWKRGHLSGAEDTFLRLLLWGGLGSKRICYSWQFPPHSAFCHKLEKETNRNV